jgi:hypothetical protein
MSESSLGRKAPDGIPPEELGRRKLRDGGHGGTLGPGLVFGYLSGRHAALAVTAQPDRKPQSAIGG